MRSISPSSVTQSTGSLYNGSNFLWPKQDLTANIIALLIDYFFDNIHKHAHNEFNIFDIDCCIIKVYRLKFNHDYA